MLPVSRDDVAALHRLRIRFKRLRYTAEMLDRFTGVGQSKKKGASGDKRRSTFAKIAKQAQRMQKHLGTLHDADVALETVAAAESLAEDDKEALTKGLLALRARLVDESVDAVEALPSTTLGS
jgi:CHAD domain-containing protein